nr:retrovirus-related Pol polyprotein from transposon TNT 1-94 [Tanacetum cinerariifolium]
MSCFSKSTQSTVKRPHQQRTTFTNKSFRQIVNTARPRPVNTVRPRPVNTVRLRLVNTAKLNSAVVNAVGVNKIQVSDGLGPQRKLISLFYVEDQGYVDSECSMHITGNMSNLLYFKKFNGGYVTFGGGENGGRITSKGTIHTASKDETTSIFKKFINEIENLVDKKVKNRALVVKPHNRTPYELFRGRTPALSFMKLFGCHVTILNTLDHLEKFDGKADEGYFVRYSMSSKAFTVYNTRTSRVKENLHIEFLKNKPIVAGAGPKWLFDIDMLTESMNYVPVIADYILMPLWKDGSLFDSFSKNATNDEPQSSCDAGNKDGNSVNKDSGINTHKKSANSINDVNIIGPSINTASTDFDTGSLNINTDSPIVSIASPEASHADFLGDKPEGEMSNITTTYQVPSTSNRQIQESIKIIYLIL